MKTSGICEQFSLAPLQSRKHGSVGITSAWRMTCALFVLCAATAIVSPAQTFRTLKNFNGTNGGEPIGALVQGLDGSFYGTTSGGGAYGYGTVFKITRGGMLMTLYSFCAQTDAYGNCTDGPFPNGLVQATDGNFFGTTTFSLFKVTPQGTLTTLRSLCPQGYCWDVYSDNGLSQGIDGNFYGATTGVAGGGSLYMCLVYGCGSLFGISPNGTGTGPAYQFEGGADGANPYGLVQGTDGNLYGTTGSGGAYCPSYGCGTVFKITPGNRLTTLYNFSCGLTNCVDGARAAGTLVQGADGNFYGTTASGGDMTCENSVLPYGCGTVFKITPGGALTTLHIFHGLDGAQPGWLRLVQATDGFFYGTTPNGGAYGRGTVFRITLGGQLTTLYSFDGADGATPKAGLVQATNGTFYGTTSGGGAYGGGTIFSLCVGLGWFTEALPSYGKVGDTIKILGTNLTGATHVRFAGNAARFTVVSPTEIDAIVPHFVTTGYVKVTLPSGTNAITCDRRLRDQLFWVG